MRLRPDELEAWRERVTAAGDPGAPPIVPWSDDDNEAYQFALWWLAVEDDQGLRVDGEPWLKGWRRVYGLRPRSARVPASTDARFVAEGYSCDGSCERL